MVPGRLQTKTEAPWLLSVPGARRRSRVRRHELADVLAEASPLGFVLGVLVRPEPVVGGPAVDHRLDPEIVGVQSRSFSGDDATPIGVPPAVEEHAVRRSSLPGPRRPPDEDLVALGSPGPVGRSGHPGRRMELRQSMISQPSSQLRCVCLGIELVHLDHRDVGQTAEIGLEPPRIRWLAADVDRSRRRVLVVHVVAVDRDLVPRLVQFRAEGPVRGTDPGGVRTDHVVVRERVGPATCSSRARRSEEPKVGRGSKIEVHTVLKLMDDAMTAT